VSFTKIKDIEKLSEFSNQEFQLVELERQEIYDEGSFFQDILNEPFRVIGKVSKKNSNEDIQEILKDIISVNSQAKAFYTNWVLICRSL